VPFIDLQYQTGPYDEIIFIVHSIRLLFLWEYVIFDYLTHV